MSRYVVTFDFEVEADSEQEAEEEAFHYVTVGLNAALHQPYVELIKTKERENG